MSSESTQPALPAEHYALDDHPDRNTLEKTLENLAHMLQPEIMRALLPDPELRGLLLAAVIHELGDLNESELVGANPETQHQILATRSKILALLDKPYKPVFIREVIDEFRTRKMDKNGMDGIIDQFVSSDIKGINSTLRNLFLAYMLNRTILEKSRYRAKVCLGPYTWKEQAATIHKGKKPALPNGTDHKPYAKFLIAIEDEAGKVVEYIDYGQTGNDKYAIKPTGEGLGAVVGRPTEQRFDPADITQVIRGLKEIQKSQDTPDDQEAVRRLGLHLDLSRQLTDFTETPDGKNFPSIVSAVDDLNEPQIDEIIQWAMKEEELALTEIAIHNGEHVIINHPGRIFAQFEGKKANVIFDQPSTRTTTATDRALEALGMEGKPMSLEKSSRKKGESPFSEAITLATHSVAALLWRGETFEQEVAAIKERVGAHNMPIMVSLGGKEHHPTQTLGEVMILMKEYGVTSVQALREKTASDPPTLAFMGHTKAKRADKALIGFVLKYLPTWKIVNIVPDEKYVPAQFQGQRNFEVRVSKSLRENEEVGKLTKDCKFVYIANQESTSGEEGKGDGNREADYFLSTDVVEKNNLTVFAPLPASGELDSNLFTHSNSRIADQMRNKIAIISSLLVHQLAARKARNPKA